MPHVPTQLPKIRGPYLVIQVPIVSDELTF